jgi:hypothetical protein
MNKQNKELPFLLESISEDKKVIRGGKNLEINQALHIAFPKAATYETFGFRKVGDDLQIKKINYI